MVGDDVCVTPLDDVGCRLASGGIHIANSRGGRTEDTDGIQRARGSQVNQMAYLEDVGGCQPMLVDVSRLRKVGGCGNRRAQTRHISGDSFTVEQIEGKVTATCVGGEQLNEFRKTEDSCEITASGRQRATTGGNRAQTGGQAEVGHRTGTGVVSDRRRTGRQAKHALRGDSRRPTVRLDGP